MPWISEQDVTAFSAYPAQDGTYGALIQLDEHGRVVLDTLSVERRGGFLFVFVNGRLITQLQVDKRVSDGKIFIPSGLTRHAIIRCRNWRCFFINHHDDSDRAEPGVGFGPTH